MGSFAKPRATLWNKLLAPLSKNGAHLPPEAPSDLPSRSSSALRLENLAIFYYIALDFASRFTFPECQRSGL